MAGKWVLMRQEDENVRRLLKTRVIRLNAPVTGLSVGLIAGIVLFLATNILILKGTPDGSPPGPHLSLLGQIFIGYTVTFVGSLIGFAWALVSGAIMGYCGAKLYNVMASINQRRAGRIERQ